MSSPGGDSDAQPDAAGGKRAKRGRAADSWAAVRKRLEAWDRPQLLGLVHDLFESLPAARAAVVGRLNIGGATAAEARAKAIEPLRKQVERAIRPSRTWPERWDFRTARRVIADYQRASGDVDGTLELYLALVETAMGLSFDFGIDDGGFYDSLCRAADRMAELVPEASDPDVPAHGAERCRTMLRHPNLPGFGMDAVVEELAEILEARAVALREAREAEERRRSGRGDWDDEPAAGSSS